MTKVTFPVVLSSRLSSSRGVQRTVKSKWLFHVFLSLLIVLCSMSTQALVDSPVGSPAQRDKGSLGDTSRASSSFGNTNQMVWNYLVTKYAGSARRGLTAEDLEGMAKSMQKCDSFQDVNSIGSDASSSGRKHNTGSHSVQVSSCRSILDGITTSSTSLRTDAHNFSLSSFEKICPQLLYYIGNADCCGTSHQPLSAEDNVPNLSSGGDNGLSATNALDSRQFLKKEKPTPGEVWGYGFLLVTIISCSSLVGVSLMPFMAKDFYKHLLTVMIGLAVGSLTGSALFHLLPQALRLSEHDPDHGYLHISLVVVGGIWLFFMIERILKFIMDHKERKGKNWKREKMSSVLTSSPESSTVAVMTENGNLMKGGLNGEVAGEQRNSLIFPTDTGVIYECQEQAIKASFGHQEKPRLSSCHDHHVTFEQGKDSVIATVAWMIIFGDGLHNFIDGLSIGAAFNESIWTGVSISVAVLCEELPHELGDFAVLLNAGMTMRQAVTYNFLSACTCYIGMAVGILMGQIEASSYIFAVAGGMFLYISLVDMVPEMNEIAEETSKVSVKKGLITLLLQNLGLFSGISALFLLALYQDSFQF